MLFADAGAELANGTTILAVLGAVLTSLFAFLSAREKLKFDGELVSLRGKIEALTQRTEDCHRERDELKAEFQELKTRYDRRHGDETQDYEGPFRRGADRPPSGFNRIPRPGSTPDIHLEGQ